MTCLSEDFNFWWLACPRCRNLACWLEQYKPCRWGIRWHADVDKHLWLETTIAATLTWCLVYAGHRGTLLGNNVTNIMSLDPQIRPGESIEVFWSKPLGQCSNILMGCADCMTCKHKIHNWFISVVTCLPFCTLHVVSTVNPFKFIGINVRFLGQLYIRGN